MALYNNVAARIAASGSVSGALRSGLSSLLNRAGAAAGGALGSSALATTAIDYGKQAAMQYGSQAISRIPGRIGNIGDLGSLDSMLGAFAGSSSFASSVNAVTRQSEHWGGPVALMGGLTRDGAKQAFQEALGTRHARKNLWIIEVSTQAGDGMADRFNLLATEVDYAPFTAAAEKRRIGGAVVDTVQGSEPVEMRLTTLDDEAGSIKRWYAARHAAMSNEDGSIGLPVDYAVRIKVVHAFVKGAGGAGGGYEDIGLFRPANLEITLSRREDALQELQLTFSQMDTFVRATAWR